MQHPVKSMPKQLRMLHLRHWLLSWQPEQFFSFSAVFCTFDKQALKSDVSLLCSEIC
jgi:hypothetical protein